MYLCSFNSLFGSIDLTLMVTQEGNNLSVSDWLLTGTYIMQIQLPYIHALCSLINSNYIQYTHIKGCVLYLIFTAITTYHGSWIHISNFVYFYSLILIFSNREIYLFFVFCFYFFRESIDTLTASTYNTHRYTPIRRHLPTNKKKYLQIIIKQQELN